jgi:hypothetical protein
MAQEFAINSSSIENKINQLLPSQGGFGAGVDFSASTMVIPIVDLTESAEGSQLRVDLQSAISHSQATPFYVTNATNTVLVNTTGYYRVFGLAYTNSAANANINLFDGTTSKNLITFVSSTSGVQIMTPFDFIVKIDAGDSLRCNSSSTFSIVNGNTRQLADVSGNLTNP